MSDTLAFLLLPGSTAMLSIAVGLLTPGMFNLSDAADGLTYPSEVEMEAGIYFGLEAAIPQPDAAGATRTQLGAAFAATRDAGVHSSSKEGTS